MTGEAAVSNLNVSTRAVMSEQISWDKTKQTAVINLTGQTGNSPEETKINC